MKGVKVMTNFLEKLKTFFINLQDNMAALNTQENWKTKSFTYLSCLFGFYDNFKAKTMQKL